MSVKAFLIIFAASAFGGGLGALIVTHSTIAVTFCR